MNLEYWNDQFNRVDVLEEEILRCATDPNVCVVVCADTTFQGRAMFHADEGGLHWIVNPHHYEGLPALTMAATIRSPSFVLFSQSDDRTGIRAHRFDSLRDAERFWDDGVVAPNGGRSAAASPLLDTLDDVSSLSLDAFVITNAPPTPPGVSSPDVEELTSTLSRSSRSSDTAKTAEIAAASESNTADGITDSSSASEDVEQETTTSENASEKTESPSVRGRVKREEDDPIDSDDEQPGQSVVFPLCKQDIFERIVSDGRHVIFFAASEAVQPFTVPGTNRAEFARGGISFCVVSPSASPDIVHAPWCPKERPFVCAFLEDGTVACLPAEKTKNPVAMRLFLYMVLRTTVDDCDSAHSSSRSASPVSSDV